MLDPPSCVGWLTYSRAAELANSLPTLESNTSSFDTDTDSQMQDVDLHPPPSIFPSTNSDPEEARLEAQEFSKYLLAKSYFDCREYDRCAAVFLPSALPRAPLSPVSPNSKSKTPTKAWKGKGRESEKADRRGSTPASNALPNLSQKALFLALYAKYMSGEKRKNEDGEMILGPADGGTTVNRELIGIAASLQGWFAERAANRLEGSNQGWLEYLYGIVLAKGKTDTEAKSWLLRSVHLCPFNWGAWLELSELINNVEEVGLCLHIASRLSLIFGEAPKNRSRAATESHNPDFPPLCEPGIVSVVGPGP